MRGVTAAIVLLLVASASLAQAPKKVPDGPASVELRAMAKADQEDRAGTMAEKDGKLVFQKPTAEQERRMVENDGKRRARLLELLRDDKLTTGEDFANAALVFQHQATPDDFLASHELSIIANRLGQLTSGAAISEDRFLSHIGRVQRFGSQYAPAADGKGYDFGPVDEGRETSVTDGLRAQVLTAPLALVRRDGPQAMRTGMDALFARLTRERDPKWLAEAEKRPESRELAKRAAQPDEAGGAWALALYRRDGLATPADYRNAATLIRRRPDADSQLLAHELAMAAYIRGDAAAGLILAETLDAYLVAVGQPQRYGTATKRVEDGKPVPPVSPTVTDAVRARFGVPPLAETLRRVGGAKG